VVSPVGFRQLPQPARVLLGTQFFFDIIKDRNSEPFNWWRREQQSIPLGGLWISCLTPIMISDFLQQNSTLPVALSNILRQHVMTFAMHFQNWRLVAPLELSILWTAKSLETQSIQVQSVSGQMRKAYFFELCVLATAINGFSGRAPMHFLDYPQPSYAALQQSHNLLLVPWI
jgi:hypothetical protein